MRSQPKSPSKRSVSRLLRGPWIGFAALLLAGCLASGVDVNEPLFRMDADSSLVTYKRVVIIVADTSGNMADTLYNDTLPTMARLQRLPAGHYQGGTARISILAYRGTHLAYRETRLYDGKTQALIDVNVVLYSDTAKNTADSTTTTGNAPTLLAVTGDTILSINDFLSLDAIAADADGDLAAYAWRCGDGGASASKPADDSGALSNGYRSNIHYNRMFPDSGIQVCALTVTDMTGKKSVAKVKVRVELDLPIADAGHDTTVAVNSTVYLHAKGVDGIGPIVTREWKIGSGDFYPLTAQESVIMAPPVPGKIICVLRVTDSDGLIGLDTMVLTVTFDPRLRSLNLSSGQLLPSFQKDIFEYTADIAWQDSVLMLFPSPVDSNSRVRIEQMDVHPPDSGLIELQVGDNFIHIQVTSSDGATLQYLVDARREEHR